MARSRPTAAGHGAGLVLVLAMALMLVAPACAEPPAVGAEASLGKGYGRVVLVWPEAAPAVDALVLNGVLVASFAAPFTADLGAIRATLDPYVALIRQDADGRTLRFALKRPLVVSAETKGRAVILDLKEDATVAPPVADIASLDVKKAPPAPAPAPPPEPVKGEATGEPAPAPESPKEAAAKPGAKPQPEKPAAESLAAEKSPALPSVAEALPISASEVNGVTRIVFDWPAKVGYEAHREEGRLTLAFDREAEPALAGLRLKPPRFVKSADRRISDHGIAVELEIDPQAEVRHLFEGTSVVVELFLPEAAHAEGEGAPLAAETEILAPAAEAVQLALELRETPAGIELRFPWGGPVASAVFRRGDFIWIVFDRPATIDVSALDRRHRAYASTAETVPIEAGAALRIAVPHEILATAFPEQSALRVVLSQAIATPTTPLAITKSRDDEGRGVVTIEAARASRALWLRDPDLGDELAVVPFGGPARSLISERRFAEFRILAGAHGLIVEPWTDDLEVRVAGEAIELRRPDGLALSLEDEVAVAPPQPEEEPTEAVGFMDFAKWRGDAAKTFSEARSGFMTAMSDAEPEARTPARLELARFYLGNGLTAETLGLLTLIAQDDERVRANPAFRALRGVTQVLLGRYAGAVEDLSVEGLADDPSAALWRGAARVGLGQLAEGRADLDLGRRALGLYAPETQARFQIAAVEAALGLQDLASAERHLRNLTNTEHDQRLRLKAERLWGAYLAASGKPEVALERYQGVIDAGYVPEAVRAEFAKLQTLRGMGALEREEEIEALESLRYRWRGDDLELAVLHDLGRAYFAVDNPRKGLETLRFAVSTFGGRLNVRDVTKDMADEFERVFLEGGADKLTPVQALALFYDFRELTPIGRKGDDMIRRMADRLVDVDLLPQAAELLQHQVDHRLSGVARAQVATRLALVLMMDRRPEEALRVINSTRQTLLPESLNRQRRLLEARALAALKRHDHALEVIEDDGRPEARELRADILWDAQDWARSAEAYEQIIGERWREAGPLEEETRRRVLRSAIAYSLVNDAEGLARLRQRFAEHMRSSPDAQAFEIVTARIDAQGIAFRELARQLASVSLFETFMQSLKEEYEAAPGTGTN